MKRNLTLLAIIGLLLELIPSLFWLIVRLLPSDVSLEIYKMEAMTLSTSILSIIGAALILPFFINLYNKTQK